MSRMLLYVIGINVPQIFVALLYVIHRPAWDLLVFPLTLYTRLASMTFP